MQFAESFEFIYWNQVNVKRKNLLNVSLETEQKQGREQMEFMTVEVFIYLFIYIWL